MSLPDPLHVHAGTARLEENGDIIFHLIVEGRAREFRVKRHVALALGKSIMDALHGKKRA